MNQRLTIVVQTVIKSSMEYHSYYLVFPDGDKQQIKHPLDVNDIVDINGNIYKGNYKLNPRNIAYEVTGFSKKINFKEIDWYYKLALLNVDEVESEITYRDIEERRRKEKLDSVFNNLEKKLKKRRGF